MFYDRDTGGQVQMMIPAQPDKIYAWRWPLAIAVVFVILVIASL